jgi:hypothetical protein
MLTTGQCYILVVLAFILLFSIRCIYSLGFIAFNFDGSIINNGLPAFAWGVITPLIIKKGNAKMWL